MQHHLHLPLTAEKAAQLSSGDQVLLSGILYTARDAAHKRLVALLRDGRELPFDLQDAVIYYTGPTPPKPGMASGAAGPTTSSRMDAYTPELLRAGLRGMIGKGKRSPEVITAMQEAGAVYLGTIGGAGALLAQRIISSEVVAFADLGPEAIHRLVVAEFPATVIIDSRGENLYENGRRMYLEHVRFGDRG